MRTLVRRFGSTRGRGTGLLMVLTLAQCRRARRRTRSRPATSPATASTSAWHRPRRRWTPGSSSSPFLAVGIYISGDSRGCRNQPNLTRTWVRTQLEQGLAAAADHARPAGVVLAQLPEVRRRRDDRPDARRAAYAEARTPGRRRGVKHRRAAHALGIVEGARSGTTSRPSTTPTRLPRVGAARSSAAGRSSCTRSATSPASTPAPARASRRSTTPGSTGPTSSPCPTGSGSPGGTRWPTPADYIRNDGWLPGGRMKQYRGGHHETWGGVTINIDRNFLDLGKGSYAPPVAHCGDTTVDFRTTRARARHHAGRLVNALQCLLKEAGDYGGALNGSYAQADPGRRRPLADRPRLHREQHLVPAPLDGAHGGRTRGRSSSSARPASPSAACSGRSTPPPTATGSR